ncbi:MAG: hypothetical protein ACTSXP_04315 [Promethearchaeota archaeon]
MQIECRLFFFGGSCIRLLNSCFLEWHERFPEGVTKNVGLERALESRKYFKVLA